MGDHLCEAFTDPEDAEVGVFDGAWSQVGVDDIGFGELLASLDILEAACPDVVTPELAADSEPIPMSFTLLGDERDEFTFSAVSGCQGEGGYSDVRQGMLFNLTDERGDVRLSQVSYDSVSHDTGGSMSPEYGVGPLLGLGDKTEAEMEESVRSGALPASALIELVRHLSNSERGPRTTAVAERIVSRATWNRALKNPRARLSPVVADRVERVGQLVAHAESVWGDRDDAREFVTSRQALLAAAPLDMAAESTVGARRAGALLGRIDYGIVA